MSKKVSVRSLRCNLGDKATYPCGVLERSQGPAPTCVPCVEGRQRAAPHSSEFPPTEAPLQTLHMDVWGPARVRGQGHERYFLLVVDDYSRFTIVFPLRRKDEVTESAAAPVMASPSVLTFDAEGRAIDFDVWLDDLQLFLQCDSKDGLSLFDLTSGASTAPTADVDSAVRSQWLTRNAAARLAVRSHLPSTERAHFSQYKSAKTLYDAVVARYSSPATTALSRLMLQYLFPDLAAFATVTDLITHLRTSDTRYRATLPAEFCAKNPPPMYITLYYLVTRLSDTLRSEPLVVTPVPLSFEGCSPIPLLPSVASPAAVDLVGTESVSAASTPSERRRNGKVKRGKGTGGGGGGGGSGGGGGGRGGGGGGGRGGGVGGSSGGGGSGGGGGWGGGGRGGGSGAGRGGAVQQGPQHQSRSRETPSPQQLREWYAGRQGSGGAGPCTYVLHTGDRTGEQCGASESAAPGARESAAPGTRASALSGTASAQVLHTFTLDSGASRSFFRVRTTLTLLSRTVAVSLADPSGGPVLARYSIVLPCPAAPSGSLSGLYLPLFSTNLVSGADLQDGGADQFTPARQRVTHCTCAQTGRHLATFTRGPGSSLYTLTTESPPVAASGQVAASCQVFAAASRSGPESAPCSCRLQCHHTLLWHHRLGHPSLPRLRGMASCVLVSGLPRSLPPLPPGPAPTCIPCVEGRQRAARHSSEFPPTEAPLERFSSDFPVLRLHSDRGGEFSSDLLRAFCRAEGIRQTFTLPASPQQNGIAERRIGMVMDSRVSIPETSPTPVWTGKVGDASAFHVWGSRAFFRDLSADKLSSRAVPCVFLSFPRDAPGWQFYHPTSHHVLSSQDVTFDESVPYYRLFPYRAAPLPPLRRSSSRPFPPR
ncbi:unnamed protein product [Closterium sp. NIES-54]